METIFDHNLSEEEILSFWSDFPEKDYLDNLSQEAAYLDIYRLFLIRGECDTAKKYLSKIKQKDLLEMAKEIAYTDIIDDWALFKAIKINALSALGNELSSWVMFTDMVIQF
mgnify:CR=1 FL=1